MENSNNEKDLIGAAINIMDKVYGPGGDNYGRDKSVISNNEQKSVEELACDYADKMKDQVITAYSMRRYAFIAGHTAATEGKDELFRNFIRENSLSSKWEKYLSKQPNF